MEDASLLQEVDVLVMEEGKIVTSKWLSLHMAIPISRAKRALVEYSNQKAREVSTVWQVSGWLKEASGAPRGSQGEASPQFQVSIATGDSLEETLSLFSADPVPVPHVYSVQKTLPVDPALLCVAEKEQAETLLHQKLDNRSSAVKYMARPVPDKSKIVPPKSQEEKTSNHSAPVQPLQRSKPETDSEGHPHTSPSSTPKQEEAEKVQKQGEAESVKTTTSSMQATATATPQPAPEAKAADRAKQPLKKLATPSPRLGTNSASVSTPSTSSLASLWKKSPHNASSKNLGTPSAPQEAPEEGMKGYSKAETGTPAAKAGTSEPAMRQREGGKRSKDSGGGEDDADANADEAGEFAALWAGELRVKGGSSRRQGKRTKVVDDDEEDDKVEQVPERTELGASGKDPSSKPDVKGVFTHTPETQDKPMSTKLSYPNVTESESDQVSQPPESRRGSDPMDAGEGGSGEAEMNEPVASKSESVLEVKEGSGLNSVPLPASNASPVSQPPETISAGERRGKEQGSGKRKKVLKTVIDERGRETTVVVWENGNATSAEATCATPALASAETDSKHQPSSGTILNFQPSRSAATLGHEPSAAKAVPPKSKAAGKGAKGPGQGSITAFFRKRS